MKTHWTRFRRLWRALKAELFAHDRATEELIASAKRSTDVSNETTRRLQTYAKDVGRGSGVVRAVRDLEKDLGLAGHSIEKK
jgi:hypothetical protein